MARAQTISDSDPKFSPISSPTIPETDLLTKHGGRRPIALPQLAAVAWSICIVVAGTSVIDAADPPITAAAFSTSGKELVVGSQAGLKMAKWPISQTTTFEALATQIENIHHIAFSPDGDAMLVAGGSPASGGVIELWNWPQKELQRRIAIGDDVVYQAIWSPDSSKWIAACADAKCRVIESASGKELLVYEDHSRPVLGIDWIGVDGQVVSVGVDQTLRLWDPSTGKHLRTLDNHLDTIQGVFTLRNSSGPNPIAITFGDDQTVRMWQPTIGRMMRFIKLATKPICGTISDDGKRIYVGCHDGSVQSIDAQSMQLINQRTTKLDSIFEITQAPDKRHLVACGIGGIEVLRIDAN
jgi:WD40 repeat protein